ncbi:hypothetical protein [Xanthobacter agilis]|uniref:Uncharacterized protein n=1 Tax=Xanthobacter agilis TaxID=47492 RepID=A0ABU0LGM2_XANAG|nr:hypothetical protein [Xanthobacter agilis]MDQ0506296.1 hypothetical protein [Xanthobacter agilis]
MTMRDQEQRPAPATPDQKAPKPGASRQQQQAQMPGQKGGQPQQEGQHTPPAKDDARHGQR